MAKSRVRRARALIDGYGTGAYANYADPDLDVRDYYGANLARLRRIKREVDPANRFRPRAGDQVMVSGVPTGISFASRRMSALRSRTQPCEMLPGISPGRFVPWTPTMPAARPVGQRRRGGARDERQRPVAEPAPP